MDFRSCINRARQREYFLQIDQPLNANLDAANKIIEHEPHPVLLKNINDIQVAANIFSQRENYADCLNIPEDDFLRSLSDILNNETAAIQKNDSVYGEVEWDGVNLTKLPILTHYVGDGGPYITSAVWIVKDPVLRRNLSYHRFMVLNKTQGSVRVVENRGMYQAIKNSGGEAEVAICIGVSPAVLLAAACSPPANVDEIELAARLDKVELVKCKTVDLDVPIDCEIVLEGRFIKQFASEGPFVDITGTWDKVRQQPIVEITRIAHRKNPIYHALIPGKSEHQMLMGMPKELDIYNAVNEVCKCLDVHMTKGGNAWLHTVVKINKQKADDGKLAIEAAFDAHKSLKHCIIVDEDINIHNPVEVEWAIATRFQADKDLFIRTDQPSSSLDPSATHIKGQKSKGSKVGFDATIKKNGDLKEFFYRVNHIN
jgi:2,5-furandicarboxylate decarboxylase 1